MIANHSDEGRTVFLQLSLADTAHQAEFIEISWQVHTHLLQGAVVENDIGGHTSFLGEFSTAIP